MKRIIWLFLLLTACGSDAGDSVPSSVVKPPTASANSTDAASIVVASKGTTCLRDPLGRCIGVFATFEVQATIDRNVGAIDTVIVISSQHFNSSIPIGIIGGDGRNTMPPHHPFGFCHLPVLSNTAAESGAYVITISLRDRTGILVSTVINASPVADPNGISACKT